MPDHGRDSTTWVKVLQMASVARTNEFVYFEEARIRYDEGSANFRKISNNQDKIFSAIDWNLDSYMVKVIASG